MAKRCYSIHMNPNEISTVDQVKNKITKVMEENGYIYLADKMIFEKHFFIEKIRFSICCVFDIYGFFSRKLTIRIDVRLDRFKEILSIIADEDNIEMLPSEIERNVVYFWILSHNQFYNSRFPIDYKKHPPYSLPLNITSFNTGRTSPEVCEIEKDLTELSYKEAYKHFFILASRFGYFVYEE